MNLSISKDHFLKYGHVKIQRILTPPEINTLKNECIKLMDKPVQPWTDYQKYKFSTDGGSVCFSDYTNMTVYTNITGQSQLVDDTLEKILSYPFVKKLLTDTIGPGYKLWHVSIRKSEPNGPGMPLHQDSPGEVVLSILLDDTPDLAGTTVFLPKTHLFPLSIHETLIDKLPFKLLRWFLAGVTGSIGDMGLFMGRIYHGRYPHNKNGNLCIMMSLFAVGSRYHLQKTPASALKNMGPELRRLLDPDNGLKYLENGKVEVLPNSEYASFTPHKNFKFVLNGRGNLSALSPWRVVQLFALFFSGRKNMKAWFNFHIQRYLSKKNA